MRADVYSPAFELKESLALEPRVVAIWPLGGVPLHDVDATRLRAALESEDPERLGQLLSMLIDHVVVGVDLWAGAVVAEGRFDLRSVHERPARR